MEADLDVRLEVLDAISEKKTLVFAQCVGVLSVEEAVGDPVDMRDGLALLGIWYGGKILDGVFLPFSTSRSAASYADIEEYPKERLHVMYGALSDGRKLCLG